MTKLLRFIGYLGFAWAAFSLGVMLYPLSLLLGLFLLCWWFRSRKRLWEHGTARWATPADIPAAKGGILLGRLGKRLIRLPVIHAAVFAPTGVGKGVSFIVPHLLSCPDSCVVIDFKGELAKITGEARRRMGHKIVMLDPFRVVTQTPDCFNPIDFIDEQNPEMLDACRDLAQALVVRTGQEKDPYWNDSAEFYIRALTTYVARFARGAGQIVPDGEDGGGEPEETGEGDTKALPGP